MNEELLRLMELTGYKDVANTIKNIDQKHKHSDHPTYDAKQDFFKYLQKNGFRKIGEGASAGAFVHPNLDYCIKIFTKDSAYEHFVHFCSKHRDNPHLPRFRGKLLNLDNLYAIRLELLTNGKLNKQELALADMTSRNMNILRRWLSNYQTSVPGNNPEFAKNYLEKHPLLKQTLVDLVDNLDGFELDLHKDNYLKRGDTLVIVDPFYDW